MLYKKSFGIFNFVIKQPADVEYDENGRNEAVEIMFPIVFRRIA